jgi:adenine modification enzyme
MAKKDYIYDTQGSLWGSRDVIGFGSPDFHIREIPRKEANAIIIKNHYSKKVCNAATTHIHLGVFIEGDLLGVLQYGYAMNPQSMNKVVKDTELYMYKELNRMWLDDKAGRNSESKAISYSIKYIRQKHKAVKWIQSFADERCGGLGIVYQAANFNFYGTHKSVFWEFEDEVFHNSAITNNNRSKKSELEKRGFWDKAVKHELRQFRYIFFIDKRWKKQCLLKEQPYPKHYKEKKDAE